MRKKAGKGSGTALVACFMLFGFAAGCGQARDGGSSDAKPEASQEPVTITMFQQSAQISDEEFAKLIADPVHRKFPNVTVEIVRYGKDTTAENLVVAGQFPDLSFISYNVGLQLKKLKVLENLNGMITKQSFDLDKFDPLAMQQARSFSDQGEVYLIPFSLNTSALYYNRDIFDKFGTAYPQDGMTWDDAIQLAKKITRTDSGIQYKGLYAGIPSSNGTQLPEALVDVKTGKALLNTDRWKTVLSVYKEVMDIPGNTVGNAINEFEKERTLAMLPSAGARIGELEQMQNEGKGMNWDMATYPAYPQSPRASLGVNVHYMAVSSQSAHKELAFAILSFLTEADNQLEMTRNGRMSSLKDPKMKEAFGTKLSTYPGRNFSGIFKSPAAPDYPRTDYDDIVGKYITAAANNYASGKVDLNTALRQAEEQASKEIEALKQ